MSIEFGKCGIPTCRAVSHNVNADLCADCKLLFNHAAEVSMLKDRIKELEEVRSKFSSIHSIIWANAYNAGYIDALAKIPACDGTANPYLEKDSNDN